ncbi:hypothetical protein [Gracilimonas mengyeensis]|uniref:Uncharacterized protein n=1 Tax=Gracilimonas mengyeensis TaxID=1302730 RepID=A0A521ETW5_9BACT|nr:hypothetical protein [Gracilimonas mengyeensis]SMO87362.1 hypothetical protein SAMN06265219_113149 [Gracilimonas mengyeensis]
MFNLFKKEKPKEEGSNLAKEAKIEIVLEKGHISGFLIFIEGNPSSISDKLKNNSLVKTFVSTIEDRIKNKDYEDPRNALFDDLILEDIKEDDVSNVMRAVFSTNNQPLFKWQPDK